jgi:ubiquinone/menaquinone biosynthesis C-methylase UbiE
MVNADRKKIVQRYYAVRSRDYDKQKSRTWKSDEGFGTEVFNELIDAFASFDGKLLLEIGVGSGRNAKPLLEKVKLQLIGLDLTKEMVLIAKNKLLGHRKRVDLIVADAERLPFKTAMFDGILCVSTMHYFEHPEDTLENAAQALKNGGTFFYGDLSPHESDDQEFFERLERAISKAHFRYLKPSQLEHLFDHHGFKVTELRSISYRKSYESLIEDKANYFGIESERIHRYVREATLEAKNRYELTETDLTQFYTIIVAVKKESELQNA